VLDLFLHPEGAGHRAMPFLQYSSAPALGPGAWRHSELAPASVLQLSSVSSVVKLFTVKSIKVKFLVYIESSF
jgi:hypothetical protein